MKIYVAGKFTSPLEIHAVQANCQNNGHTITYDWTTNHIPLNSDLDTVRRLRRIAATADLEGVNQADIVLALFADPSYAYRGTFTELGFALAQGKRVFAVCPHYFEKNIEPTYATNCFFESPGVHHYASVEEALAALSHNGRESESFFTTERS